MIKLTMPSGIHYQIPIKRVSGSHDRLRNLWQAIMAVEDKAESLHPPDNRHPWHYKNGAWRCLDRKCEAKETQL